MRILAHRSSELWDWTEHLRFQTRDLPRTPHHRRQRQKDPEVLEAFGQPTPPPDELLLHYAGDPTNSRPTPVLLVHGAGVSGYFWYRIEKRLPVTLRQEGFRVYFLSLPHNQDDNFVWAQQIYWALQRVHEHSGSDQVDVVAHSKGGFGLRLLLSEERRPWMNVSTEGIRKALFVATPLGGADYSFRYPFMNWAIYCGGDNPRLNAPISWEEMVVLGRWRSSGPLRIGSEHWPGQRQFLSAWDHRYPIPRYARSTYYGGRGKLGRSRGIHHYIEMGGKLVERLRAQPIPNSVQVGLLAGDRADIPFFPNEKAGPSDGLLLVESAWPRPPRAGLIGGLYCP